MKFLYGNDKTEIVKNASYSSLPEELYGIWFNFAFIKDVKNFSVICSAYKNDQFPSGSIVVTNKIYNDFPIAQSAWSKNSQISRMYVDPFFRNKKIAKYSVISNDMIASYLGLEPWSAIYSDKGGTVAGDQLYNKIFDLGFKDEKQKIDLNDIFQYRNYSFPITYFDKRAVYDENAIQQD